MQFGTWYPLEEAAAHAPASPGVFQVRLREGLIDYPRGKSAMVHYEVAGDVRAAASAFAAGHPGRPWLCRHTIEMSAEEVDDVDAFHRRLLRDFVNRFGAPPTQPPA
jgi:hypothetical protein